jgi:hypothetical protein
VTRSYEALLAETERDGRFARRVQESAARVLAFKKKSAELKRRMATPGPKKVQQLSRQLWEFSEQVRFAARFEGIEGRPLS